MYSVTKSTIFIIITHKIKNVATISTTILNKEKDYDLVHPEGHEPTIPKYKEKTSEDIATKRARLVYQSRKRGMLENGLILSTFAKKYLQSFDESQLKMYDELINLPSNDWDIFNWATEAKPTPPEFDNHVMNLLKKHVRNEEKRPIIGLPEL